MKWLNNASNLRQDFGRVARRAIGGTKGHIPEGMSESCGTRERERE